MQPFTRRALAIAIMLATAGSAHAASMFLPGNLVVAVEGNGPKTAGVTYADNAAAPLSLHQYSLTGTSSAAYVNTLVLPQRDFGGNHAISGELGSSSEGFLHLTADGRYLTLMGYGVNADAFNANPTAYGTAVNNPAKPTALGQSGSLTGQGYIPVSRVVALIGANGGVDTSTAVFNVFNGNNPRAAASADGSTFYISGQGNSPDHTGGVYYVTKGASSAGKITGDDTSGGTSSQDTRDVQIVGGKVYVSVDSKQGSNAARDFIGTLGDASATYPGLFSPLGSGDATNGPTALAGFQRTGKVNVTAATGNEFNTSNREINLSPEQFFFADASTLYIADAGSPKNDSASNARGNGGLQKWKLINNNWVLQYTISAGLLDMVRPDQALTTGTTGLFGLTGKVVGGQVYLYATNYTIGDLDQTYLYGITDTLSATTKAVGQKFTKLDTAPTNTKFRGLSFAPTADITPDVPEPASWALMMAGFGAVGAALRRGRRSAAARA